MAPVAARRSSGWLVRPYFKGQHQTAKCVQPIDEELWLTLRHPAEVVDAGRRLIARHGATIGPGADEALLREFRSYVRQAENFYRGAQVLPWKSSPLNFYYSFLNLAKAYALIAGALPVFVGSSATSVSAGPVGPRRNRWGSPATHRIMAFPSKWAFRTTSTGSWDVLAIPSAVPRPLLGAEFEAEYEEVEHASIKGFALDVWNLPAADSATYMFFQRRAEQPVSAPGSWNLDPARANLENILPHSVFEFLSSNSFQILLCLPCVTARGSRRPMNQEIATYATMFFLSSLVRYHPEYMDEIAQSSDAWLIESFVKSAPLELLRSLTAKILGYTLIIEAL